MGLNIGIHVKKQSEGYGNEGCNPKGSQEEIEDRFFEFLNNRFPKGGFGGGWVHTPMEEKGVYDFDVRVFRYGSELEANGYKVKDMYLAITEFIYENFSHLEGIKLETYWSG